MWITALRTEQCGQNSVMTELMLSEKLLLGGLIGFSAVSSILAYVQTIRDAGRIKEAVGILLGLQIAMAGMLLGLRAAAIEAFPLTGVFESILAVLVFIGFIILCLWSLMRRVWFSSVMAWTFLGIVLLAWAAARPVSSLNQTVRTPLVIVHSLSMAIAGAMIVLGGAAGLLFLWSRRRLKSKQLLGLLGKMPTIETLEHLMLAALWLGFAALTAGLVSGIGLAAVKSAQLGLTARDWAADFKVVLIAAAWLGLLAVLVLRHLSAFSGKTAAQAAVFLCLVILFAFVGSRLFYTSRHQFEMAPANPQSLIE